MPPGLRVAVDATPLIGPGTGVATFARGALRSLAGRDELELLAYALSWRGRGGLRSAVPDRVRPLATPLAAGPLLRLWERSDAFPVELWAGAVDVVHGTNFVVPPARRAARVVTVHDLTAVRHPDLCTATSLRYPHLIRRAAHHGAWVHTPSDAMAREVVDLLGVPEERVRAVPHGVSVAHRGDPDAGRQLAGTDRYVLALGTVEPRKDLPGLVRAFDIVAADDGDVRLVIAGPDGWGASALADAMAAASARSRITRIGWVGPQERSDLLAGATVLAYPSVYEGFGLPPLEAMTAGTPVVATDAGALPEVVGDAALLVPVGDAEALAAAVAQVLTDTALAAELARRGRARAAGFTWEACATGLAGLYAAAAEW